MARGKSATAFIGAWLVILFVVGLIGSAVVMLGRYLWGMVPGSSAEGPENAPAPEGPRPLGGDGGGWPDWDDVRGFYMSGTTEGQRNALANWWGNLWGK